MDDADRVGSTTLVAVMVTVAGDGTVAGAVYSPLEEIVPQAIPLQPVPDTVQVTASLVAPVTDAANCFVVPAFVEALAGVTETATGATPVPATPITAVPLVEELLVTVS
jgi:hypothetical protein